MFEVFEYCPSTVLLRFSNMCQTHRLENRVSLPQAGTTEQVWRGPLI
jgi:hypothetical protein